jgi:hypothetical protein
MLSGKSNTVVSEWLCESINPGVTVSPFASIIFFASAFIFSAIRVILPSDIAISDI